MKKKILIVEDYPSIAMDEEGILKHLNYDVIGISISGKDAVKRSALERPDAVLMDIQLKGKMDGIQAAQEIHKTFGIPVVFVTAFGDKEMSEWAIPPKGFGYVVKPYTKDAIAFALEEVLKS